VRDERPYDVPNTVRFEHALPGEAYEDFLPGLVISSLEHMRGSPIYFDLAMAEIVLAQFQETATHRNWTLHAVAIMYNHWHLLVVVPGDPEPRKILADFKAYGSRALNRVYGKPPSDTWWTSRGSKRKLKDETALAGGVNYVLHKQPNPLVVWPKPAIRAGEPGA